MLNLSIYLPPGYTYFNSRQCWSLLRESSTIPELAMSSATYLPTSFRTRLTA